MVQPLHSMHHGSDSCCKKRNILKGQSPSTYPDRGLRQSKLDKLDK